MPDFTIPPAVNRIVDRAIQITGSHGISEDLPLAAFYRAVRPFRIYDGPSEVHRVVIARDVLKEAAERQRRRTAEDAEGAEGAEKGEQR